MSLFSSELMLQIEKQVNADPGAVQRVVREVYAEVFGEEGLDERVAEMGIDLLHYGHRPVWEYVDGMSTGAIVGYVDYQPKHDSDRLCFRMPKDQYDALDRAFCTPGHKIGRIAACDVIQTREGTVHRSEAASRAFEHLSLMEDYLKPLVGVCKAREWVKYQSAALKELLK